MSRRVVITGLGVVSPIGTGIDIFLESLKNCKSGIQYIPELKEYGFACQIGGISTIDDSIYTNYLKQYQLEDASKVITHSIIAAIEAWHDAGLEIPEYDSAEPDYTTGAIIGSGIGSVDIFGEKIIPYTNEKKIKRLRSTIVEYSMLSGPSANLSGILALGNQVSFNSSACATGTESIIEGYERIKSGKAKRMIVGSTDIYSPYGWSGFDSMRVLTRNFNDDPQKGSCPMSAYSSGFVPGSGSGILIIEDLETAIQRKAKIYAEIAGSDINCGGQRNGGTMSAPNPSGVQACINSAIQDAGIIPGKLDYISGHLSSTMADVIEINNWYEVLGNSREKMPYINSLKANIGHAIGAAGSVETIAAILQMKYNFIHQALNSEKLHPEIEQLVPREKIPTGIIENIKINYAAKASFGFGDVNACVILKNYE